MALVFRVSKLFTRKLGRNKLGQFIAPHQVVSLATASRPIATLKLYPKSANSNNIERIAQLRFQHASSKDTQHKTVPFILPDIGEGINEVEIKEWQVKVGDQVKEFDGICEVESDKATATISSRFEGTILKIYYQVGDKAKVGSPLVDIEVLGSSDESKKNSTEIPEARPAAQSKASAEPTSSESTKDKNKSTYEMLPSVRRLSRQANIDLAKVTGTGKNGRILKEDILAYMNCQPPTSDVEPVVIQQETTVVPLKGVRKAMFKTMTNSLAIPHFNYSDEVDLTKIMESSKQRKLAVANNKDAMLHPVSNLAIMVKFLSVCLLEYPELNASIDSDGQNLVHKHYHNIGVAVDTQAGLVVPNIKNVQNLTIIDVNNELTKLRELSYKSKLGPADLSGGTISISNIGAIGGIFGVPVVVSPEIVIAAFGKIRKLPRFNICGDVEARQIMQIVWSADHRVVDGATISRFSNLYKELLENPDWATLKLK